MCMPGTPEHDAYMKGPEAYEAFLREQREGKAEAQFDRSIEQAEEAGGDEDDD